jgi:hypothetical protein
VNGVHVGNEGVRRRRRSRRTEEAEEEEGKRKEKEKEKTTQIIVDVRLGFQKRSTYPIVLRFTWKRLILGV